MRKTMGMASAVMAMLTLLIAGCFKPVLHGDFTGSPLSGLANLSVQFQATADVDKPYTLEPVQEKFRWEADPNGTPRPIAIPIGILPPLPDYTLRVTEWLWDFGDGKPSNESAATHPCAEPGNYRVTLVVWAATGQAARAEKFIAVTQ